MNIMKKTIILFIAIGLLVLSGNASAQVFLEKGKVEHTVKPGERINGSIMVHNTSDVEIKVTTYWEDFNYIEPFDGTKKFLPAGTSEYSMASWINFSPREFSLGPFGKRELSYTIDTPANISGGYNGVLFVEKEPVESKTTKGLSIIARVGCLFFMESIAKNVSVEIQDLSFDNTVLTGYLNNSGNVMAMPKGVYYVLNSEGLAVDRGEIKNLYLPPNEKVKWNVSLPLDLGYDNYTVVMTFELSGENVLVREIDFLKNQSGFNITEIRD